MRTPQCLCFYFYWKCQEAMQYASGEEAQAVLGVIFFLFAGFIGALPRGGLPCGCALCACVFSHPVSGWDGVSLPWPVLHFSRPSPWDPHSFVPVASAASLPWSYWECWRDTQKDTITFRRNSNLWVSPCAFGDITNHDNLNILLTEFKF